MSFSYDPLLPTPIDKMRQRLQDISEPERAPNETYGALLVEMGGSWRRAAASLARSFAASAVQEPTSFTDVGVMSVAWSTPAETWLKIALALELEATAEVQPAASDRSLSVVAPTRLDQESAQGEYSNGLRGWR